MDLRMTRPQMSPGQQGTVWGHSLVRIMVPYPGKAELTRDPSDQAREEAGSLLGNFCPKVNGIRKAVVLEILVHRERSVVFME